MWIRLFFRKKKYLVNYNILCKIEWETQFIFNDQDLSVHPAD